MSYTKVYKNLPDTCDHPRKRKRIGRGRVNRKSTPNNVIRIDDTSSASDSPMKRVVFDLTGFSTDDEDEEGLQVRASTPPPTQEVVETEDEKGSSQSDDDDPAVVFSDDDGESGSEDESGSRSP